MENSLANKQKMKTIELLSGQNRQLCGESVETHRLSIFSDTLSGVRNNLEATFWHFHALTLQFLLLYLL